MNFLSRRDVKSPAPATTASRSGRAPGEYAFCETVFATPTSPEHIREVGPEGRKLGGGVPRAALCGRDLAKGWDIQRDVDLETIDRLTTPLRDGRVHLCGKCADVYRSRIS